MKGAVRDAIAQALHLSGVTAPGRCAAGRLTIATFHRVLPAHTRSTHPLPGLAVLPDELAWFLAFFARHYECGPLRDVAARWQRGEEGSRPLLAVTFDDAQRDNYLHARPVLDAVGVRATFFAPARAVDQDAVLWHDRLAYATVRAGTERVGEVAALLARWGVAWRGDDGPAAIARRIVSHSKNATPDERAAWIEALEELAGGPVRPDWDGLCSWDELATLAKEGHEVGSHTLTHPLLPQCPDDELAREIGDSRTLLEERLGSPVESFCYPNGDWDARALREVERAGYRYAVTTAWGLNDPSDSLFLLRRCDMHSEHARDRVGQLSEARLEWRMSGLHPGLR